MKHHIRILPLLPLLLSPCLLPAAENSYRLVKEIPVANAGEWKTFSFDEGTHRLYAVNGAGVCVVDLDKEQIAQQAPDIAGVRSFGVVSRMKRAFYVRDNEPGLRIVDLNSFKKISDMETGSKPAIVLVEPSGAVGYTLNAGDNSITTFEPDDGDFMGNSPLPGRPRSAIVDGKTRTVFCALEDKNEVLTFKLGQHKAIKNLPTAPGEKPSALVFDPNSQRLFAGCANNLLVMIDPASGKVVDSAKVESGADTLVVDPAAKRVFAGGSKGAVTIFQVSPQKLSPQGKLTVSGETGCLAVDPKSHKLYVGAGNKILVYGE
jgi:DNA-binding beta-propeller fold protein YncE